MLSSGAVSSFSIGAHDFFPGIVYVLAASLTTFALVLIGPKIGSLLEHPMSLFSAMALCGAGLFSFALGPQSQFSILSLSLFSCGCTILLLYWLELLTAFSPLELTLVVIGASASDSITTYAVNTINQELPSCAFCLLMSFACIVLVDKRRTMQEADEPDTQDRVIGLDRRSLIGVFAGLLIIGLSAAYSQQLALESGGTLPAYPAISQALVFVFMLCLLYFNRDINLATALKVIATLASLSLLLLLFSDAYRYAAYSVSSIAYGILAYSALYVSVLVAKSHSNIRLRILALTQCVLSFSAPFFIVIALLGVDISNRVFLFAIAFFLACASIWLLSDRSIDMLTSSSQPLADNGRKADFSAKARAVADHVGLTPREFDIFSLSIMGRSAPFIAENLVISENTVKSHLQRIYTKCGVHSRQELISLVENHER